MNVFFFIGEPPTVNIFGSNKCAICLCFVPLLLKSTKDIQNIESHKGDVATALECYKNAKAELTDNVASIRKVLTTAHEHGNDGQLWPSFDHRGPFQ